MLSKNASSYLALLQKCLLGTIYKDPPLDPYFGDVRDANGAPAVYGKTAGPLHIGVGKFNADARRGGRDWPVTAHTMIGQARLENLHACVESVLEEGVPGDFIETGVWRGGACIFMRGMLNAFGDESRKVFVADSFEGLPRPTCTEDAKDIHFKMPMLAVGLDEVKANFAVYDLLDDRVVFLKGWFKDTLPVAPIAQLAILRLDGDMFESTMDGLANLYSKVSPGGYVIVDDYYSVAGCYLAVNQFREKHRIADELVNIDGAGAYWRKSRGRACSTST